MSQNFSHCTIDQNVLNTILMFFCCSYGRVYTADPYHAALAPAAAAAAYGVGAMVRY